LGNTLQTVNMYSTYYWLQRCYRGGRLCKL